MFDMVVELVFFAELQKITQKSERKISAVGITLILCYTDLVVPSPELLAKLLEGLLSFFELPVQETENEFLLSFDAE